MAVFLGFLIEGIEENKYDEEEDDGDECVIEIAGEFIVKLRRRKKGRRERERGK